MRRAGPVNLADLVCRDLGTSVKHTKNQLHDYMEKSQPGPLGAWYRDAGIPARRVKIYHVIEIAGFSRIARPTLFRH